MDLNEGATDALNSTFEITKGIMIGTAIVAIPLLLIATTTGLISAMIRLPMVTIDRVI
jgi:hypothetical protein